MKKAVVFSLGCKVNAYEGQAIIGELTKLGYECSDKPGYADVYILNTCSVTSEADSKSRQAVERLTKFNRNAPVLVLGCSAQNDPSKYRNLKNVAMVSGVGSKIEAVRLFMSGIDKGEFEKKDDFVLPTDYEDDLFPAATKTRGYIKVQDGCDNFCSYCRIPYLRGRSRSRSIESVVSEANEVAKHSKEIILTGINVSDYRYGDSRLVDLIRALKDVPVRKRLSSLECEVVDDEFLSAMQSSGFCDHFHLSLQSGSDSVLKRMNRHYTAEEYLRKVELIYSHFPFAAVTTDMIAGFPTETEDDHLEGMETAKRAHFAAIHVFPYSERKGTMAANLVQIPKSERSRRAGELIALGAKLHSEFLSKNLGRVVEVYAETERDGLSEGFSSNYIKVYSPLKIGEMGLIKLIEPYLDGLKGELI